MLTAVLEGLSMQSLPMRVLVAFVTINTVIYSVLAVAKLLPRVYPSTWFRGRDRRAEDRSIHPGGVVPARTPDGAEDGPVETLMR